MFILPIRTNIRPRRKPYANYALIISNVVIFFLQIALQASEFPFTQIFMLSPENPQLFQFISYAFLHGGFWHIAGNMYFLYIFGNNVNDKLGNIGYLCFYLAGGVFAGLGHSLVSPASVLGASGAVAAVTGAYLVLFPKTLITVFYWLFIFIDTVQLPALYFILLKLIVWDNILERQMPNVAYEAHLAGYAFGIGAILLLLALKLIGSSHYDLWSMLKQWNRRRKYRSMTVEGFDPFAGRTSRKVRAKEVKSSADLEKENYIQELRSLINNRLNEHNTSAAANTYVELMGIDPKQVLAKQHLLDIGNQLASEGRHKYAAMAYEQFLEHYPEYEYTEQIQLMAGLIFARYLDEPEKAKKYLQAAEKKLRDPGQLKMCKDELEKLTG